jgi:CTP-dependent riboflavin kinase
MPSAYGCDTLPDPIEISSIDGKTATEAQMSSSQKATNEYVDAGKSAIACLEKLEDSRKISRSKAGKLRNNLIDQMEKAAALYNRQLRDYKRRNK